MNEQESTISIQNVIENLSNYLLDLNKDMKNQTVRESKEIVHILNDTTKAYLPPLKQLVFALKEDKFNKIESFMRDLDNYEKDKLQPTLINLENNLYAIPTQKIFFSPIVGHGIFSSQTFPFVSKIISKNRIKSDNQQNIEPKIHKLLLCYETLDEIQSISVLNNILQFQTNDYDVQLKLNTPESIFWEITVTTPKNEKIFKYPQYKREIPDQLANLNNELQYIDTSHPKLLKYIHFAIMNMFHKIEFLYGSPFISEMGRQLLHPMLKVDKDADAFTKIFQFNMGNPIIRNFWKELQQKKIISLQTQNIVKITLQQPKTFHQFKNGVPEILMIQLPEIDMNIQKVSQKVVDGDKRQFIRFEFKESIEMEGPGILSQRYIQSSMEMYTEFVDLVDEFIQQSNTSSLAYLSIMSHNKFSIFFVINY